MKNKSWEKKYFYIFIVCTLLIISLSFTYIHRINKLHHENLKELEQIIIDSKKDRLKEIIDKTIEEIDIERNSILEETKTSLKELNVRLDLMLIENKQLLNLKTLKEHSSYIKNIYPNLEILVWDNNTQKLIFNNNTRTPSLNSKKNFYNYLNLNKTYIDKPVENNSKIIIFAVSNSFIEEKLKSKIAYKIRQLYSNTDEYVWVNKILNYNGGNDYAIRLIHPNLINTEGQKLSTNTKDLKGNLPYLNELTGIRNQGEVFHEYYFKKKGNSLISRKLSYAKLYKKYDWVISCGVYLDDLEKIVSKKSEVFHKDMNKQINITILISVLCFIISSITGFIILNSRKLTEISLTKQKNNLFMKYYSILENKYDKTNEIIHDMKNHLICIKGLAEWKESKKIIEYINSINEDMTQLSNIVITNNKIIDIIINEKMYLMKKYHINFKYKVEPLSLDFIDTKDLCTIMNNLLSNSIESCNISSNKDILLKIHCFNENFIVITLINSCDNAPIICKGNYTTTKKDKTCHGYGIKNIKRSIEKYDGNISFKYMELDRKFSATILLPIPNLKNEKPLKN